MQPLNTIRRLIRILKNNVSPNNDFTNTSELISTNVPKKEGLTGELKLVNIDIGGKYKFTELPDQFDQINTAKKLQDEEQSLIEIASLDGTVFSRICKPKHHEFMYTSLVQPKEWMNAYYSEDYDDEINTVAKTPEKLVSVRSVNKVERYCAPFLKPNSQILDIGCGFGDQLSYFKNSGHTTLGLEMGETRVSFARSTYEIEAINADIEDLASYSKKLGERRFDLIYLNQVLEHLRNPLGLIQEIEKYLAVDGKIFIAVPNNRSEGIIYKMLTTVHTHSFSAAGLKSFMAFAGFELLHDVFSIGYNTMIFKKSKSKSLPSNNPTGEIAAQISRLFCIQQWQEATSGVIIQQSNIVGPMSAVYKTAGPSPKSDLSAPIIIKTNFDKPKMLFK